MEMRQENKVLKAHLNAAYQEIGQLKVRLIEASLRTKADPMTNFQYKEEAKISEV